ncbi:hypothetical protein RM549_13695 [Salegentibacter sp. F188]|uniref:Uncharacterized protein n=1 Tax=Autumnicola patrickiae TaxID=3075591 RepID=A0ABU3E4C6_9FLAO|nr:hypothetical protein [Salegentibacter sp. F188]MDT0690846.1 hypothetical protein [Salegentibacter sp. F188]
MLINEEKQITDDFKYRKTPVLIGVYHGISVAIKNKFFDITKGQRETGKVIFSSEVNVKKA